MRHFLLVSLLGLLSSFHVFSQTPLTVDANTIALWNFESDVGNSVIDSGPNAINGVANNAGLYPMSAPTLGNGRLFFVGTSYIDLGTLASHDPLDITRLEEWTVEFYLQITYRKFGEKGNIFDNGFLKIHFSDAALHVSVNRNNVFHTLDIDSTSINPGQLAKVHVVFKDNIISIFVNESLAGVKEIPTHKTLEEKYFDRRIFLGGGVSDIVSDFKVGNEHACYITDGGLVRCWGAGQFGQLGSGENVESVATPLTVNGISNASKVSTGGHSTCAIEDGKVLCWGNNDFYQLGSSLSTKASIPLEALGVTNAIDIQQGLSHACAILSDKTLKCWGNNEYGQLGLGFISDKVLPTTVPGVTDVEKVILGGNHTCVIDSSDDLYCWGDNQYGQIAQIGITESANPLEVTGLSTVASLVAGANHTCAFLGTDQVKCWGRNNRGQLGNNSYTDSAVPVSVIGLTGYSIITLASEKGDHSCVLENVRIRCWGENSSGQMGRDPSLGDHFTQATQFPYVNFFTLVLGAKNSCSSISTGVNYCWGFGGSHLLGYEYPSVWIYPTHIPLHKTLELPGYLDEVRISNIARKSLNPVTLTIVQPASNVQVEDPAIEINISSSVSLNAGTIESRLNGEIATGLSLNVNKIEGTLNIPFREGENILEVSIKNTEGESGFLKTKIFYTTVSNGDTPIKVVTGGTTSCAIHANGKVSCWGGNSLGQLGNETLKFSSTPVLNPYLKNVIDIAVSSSSICALDRDNKVWCWGDNRHGQLGTGFSDLYSRSLPTEVPLIKPVRGVRAGVHSFCALHTDDTMTCWGVNLNRLFTYSDQWSFPYPQISNYVDVKDIQFGSDHACIIMIDDSLWCGGSNLWGQIGIGTYSWTEDYQLIRSSVKEVKLGENFTCAITLSNETYCWGINFAKNVTDTTNVSIPDPQLITATSGITELYLGNQFVCGKKSTNEITCWGQNIYGTIGNNEGGHMNGPTGSYSANGYTIPSKTFDHISARGNTICGLTTDTYIYCWGANSSGQAGVESLTKVLVPTEVVTHTTSYDTISDIKAGQANTCFIKNNKNYCWGNNDSGQIGNGSYSGVVLSPVEVATSLSTTSAGYTTICHINSLGNLSCAGSNANSEMGIFSPGGVAVAPYLNTNISNVTQVELGNNFVCAISLGKVYCWGNNEFGQLGNIVPNTHLPQEILGLTDVTQIAVARRGWHACAKKLDKSVWCWGRDSNGQLGGVGDSFTAVEMKQLSESDELALSIESTCSLNPSKKIVCIGSNIYGQLGVGHNFNNDSLDSVKTTSLFSKILAGQDHICAKDLNEDLFCWGRNAQGQLGNGTNKNSSLPLKVMSNVSEFATGHDHNCAIDNNNKMWCWGFGGNGQFGNGSIMNSSIPVPADVTLL